MTAHLALEVHKKRRTTIVWVMNSELGGIAMTSDLGVLAHSDGLPKGRQDRCVSFTVVFHQRQFCGGAHLLTDYFDVSL